MELYPFDQKYLQRLTRGDAKTQAHFIYYFTNILRIKLRSRTVSHEDLRDIQQETLTRVLTAIRNNEVHQPERLGAYVNSACNNVLREYYRDKARLEAVDLDIVDIADDVDIEGKLIAFERERAVHLVLERLPEKDQAILRDLLQQRDKDEICKELGVDQRYLRILIHRVRANLRKALPRRASALQQAAQKQ